MCTALKYKYVKKRWVQVRESYAGCIKAPVPLSWRTTTTHVHLAALWSTTILSSTVGHDQPLSIGSASSAQQQDDLPFLYLTALQSCRVHGWFKPKRTLHSISLDTLLGSGLTSADLQTMQPDVGMWLVHKQLTLSDVPKLDYMRSRMFMDDDWMKLLHYSPSEWAERVHAQGMGKHRVEWVFSADYDTVVLKVSSSSPPQCMGVGGAGPAAGS
jgi:hypothetical protein